MNPKNNNDTPSAAENRAQDTSFQDRHKKELGVGAYAKESVVEGLLPWLVAGAVGTVGYFTLGKPIKRMFPKVVDVADLGKDALDLVRNNGIKDIPKVMEKVEAEFKELGDAVSKKYPHLDPAQNLLCDQKERLGKIYDEIKDHDQMAKFRTALGLGPSSELGMAKVIGAGVAGLGGALAGGTVVGYRKWKKDESTRVAAAEINEDVSHLELFRPSDHELVAENKRLRAMLAKEDRGVGTDIPGSVGISQMRHEGAVKSPELSAQVG